MSVEAFDTEIAGVAVGFVAIPVDSRRVVASKRTLAFFAAEDVALLKCAECDVVLPVLLFWSLIEALITPRADSCLQSIRQMTSFVELPFIPTVLDVPNLTPHHLGDDNAVSDAEDLISV